MLHHLVDVRLRILPGIDGHLGLRGEAGHLHRNLAGCAGTSSGATSSSVRMERTKSRDTVNTKSAPWCTCWSGIMDHLHRRQGASHSRPQPLMLFW
jgi:hypothetical protein